MARKPTAGSIASANSEQAALDWGYFQPLYPWQLMEWQQVTRRFPAIPHALLLTGIQGIGKRRFAHKLAAFVLCQQPVVCATSEGLEANHSGLPADRPRLTTDVSLPCGRCDDCQWLAAGSHPSLMRIGLEVDAKGKPSKQLKIDQIRELMPFVQKTGEGWRVVILDPAETLNVAASNALLKTLEEPGSQTLFLLITDQPMQLLPTIRSRLQTLRLPTPPLELAQRYLASHAPVIQVVAAANTRPNEEADAQHIALTMASGAPLKAETLMASTWFGLRQDWLQGWRQLVARRISPISVSQQWQSQLPLAEGLTLLHWLLQDMLACHLGLPMIQTDLPALPRFSQAYRVEALTGLQQTLLKMQQTQAQNVQGGLVYDSLVHTLASQSVMA